MNTVQIRGLALGAGRPKICVPLTGTNVQTLYDQIGQIKQTKADMVEWRVDYFDDVMVPDKMLAALGAVRRALRELPLLFTFRTAGEGGERDIAIGDYKALLSRVLASGCVDAVDVELYQGDAVVKAIIEKAHKNDVRTVISNHDFVKTPQKREIIARLQKMRLLGGDVPKMAVMPANFEDVLTLMAATHTYTETADCPVITVSMGQLGGITRIAGGFYGSALTFGCIGNGSAPGQLHVAEMSAVLDILG